MNIGVCNSYLVVDLKKIKNNITKINKQIGQNCSIMPVLKGNAYGMGLTEIAKYLIEECNINIIANAQVYESLQLRESGIECELFVMGGVPYHNIEIAVEKDIQMPVFNIEFAALVNNEAKKQGKIANLHIKIETGLNRIGVKPGEKTEELIEYLKTLSNIRIKGVYTHFIESEAEDKSYSYKQLKIFKKGLKQIEDSGIKPEYIHTCNAAAVAWFKEAYFNLVRTAGIVLGYDPNIDIKNRLGVESPLTWKAFVTNVKEIKAGEAIGYNRKFTATRKMKVATLSFGFGDGYIRSLAFDGAEVLIKGKRAPLIGICMDQAFVDVSDIDKVSINDEVTILGKDGGEEIDIFEMEKLLGQTYVYPLCMIGQRVKRIYKYN